MEVIDLTMDSDEYISDSDWTVCSISEVGSQHFISEEDVGDDVSLGDISIISLNSMIGLNESIIDLTVDPPESPLLEFSFCSESDYSPPGTPM